MKTLLLLDVDGVLLNWDALNRGRPPTIEETGYDDWVASGRNWFSYFSPNQLADIAAAPFDLYWHTTWCLDHNHPKMLNYFREVTGFGEPNNRRLQGLLPPDWDWPSTSSGIVLVDEWWKASIVRAVATLTPDFFRQYDKVLWVDDHLRHYGHAASAMLTETGADKGPTWYLIECNQGAWDKQSIEHHAEQASGR